MYYSYCRDVPQWPTTNNNHHNHVRHWPKWPLGVLNETFCHPTPMCWINWGWTPEHWCARFTGIERVSGWLLFGVIASSRSNGDVSARRSAFCCCCPAIIIIMSLSCRSLLPVAYFPLLPSLVDCCVLLQPLRCGCSSRPNSNTVTPAKLASDLGIQIDLWSENDATKTSWLGLISSSDYVIHPY